MIHEIAQFINYLDEKSPDVFSQNLKLKEGLFIFLEKAGNELVIKKENILTVDKKTECNQLYDEFIQRYSVTEMIRNKSLNSSEKIFIEIGSPFAISISGKGQKNGRIKKTQAAEAYFKATQKFLNKENKQHVEWFNNLKSFVRNIMFDYLDNLDEYKNPKDTFMFYFFMKEPEIKDYVEFYDNYLQTKVFLYDLKKSETHGISNDLNVFNVKKTFLKHQSATFDVNYKIPGTDAMKLYKFFRLQQKNKILPNPMPIFVDKDEINLSEKAIKFFNSKKDKKCGYKEIIEQLLSEHKNDLQNYYLIFFQNNLKGSRIVDLDFVPVFKHKLDKEIKIETLFNTVNNKIHFNKIETVFDFERIIVQKIFNNSLVQYSGKNETYSLKYFDEIDNNPKYITSNTYIQIMKYRKMFYDFIYKSKHQLITDIIFHNIMQESIIDDLKHDEYKADKKYHTKEKQIKEKLNIWFSLYNYFETTKNTENMINKTEELFERLKVIAKNNNERIRTDEEFAFASGQLIWKLLIQSESSNRTHAMLEPFLQKSDSRLFKQAISRTYEMYKHKFTLFPLKYEFDKIMSEVMGVETDTNIKSLLPLILAGYFSETIFKKETE